MPHDKNEIDPEKVDSDIVHYSQKMSNFPTSVYKNSKSRSNSSASVPLVLCFNAFCVEPR